MFFYCVTKVKGDLFRPADRKALTQQLGVALLTANLFNLGADGLKRQVSFCSAGKKRQHTTWMTTGKHVYADSPHSVVMVWIDTLDPPCITVHVGGVIHVEHCSRWKGLIFISPFLLSLWIHSAPFYQDNTPCHYLKMAPAPCDCCLPWWPAQITNQQSTSGSNGMMLLSHFALNTSRGIHPRRHN